MVLETGELGKYLMKMKGAEQLRGGGIPLLGWGNSLSGGIRSLGTWLIACLHRISRKIKRGVFTTGRNTL